MPEALGHLLGHGRRWPWHLFTLLWLVPILLTLEWLYELEPGKGPQGGEAIVLFLLTAVMGLLFCTVVNAFRLYGTRAPVGALGWLRRSVAVFGGVLAALVLFWKMLDKGTSMVTADGFDAMGWAGAIAVLAVLFLFNVVALVRCCAHADLERT